MTLAKLLELHLQSQPPRSLPRNWGDGFLVEHNPIFRRVRSQSLKLGYQFTSDPSLGYRTLPLAEIETLLLKKTLPFQDNVSAIENLGPKLLACLSWDDISDQLVPNRVFHESCHAVFRSGLSNERPDLDLFELQRARAALWEESFANACELMASMSADSTAHKCFLQSNSYFFVPECRATLKQLSQGLPIPWLFAFAQICYFHSNHLLDRLDDKEFNETLAASNRLSGENQAPGPSERKVLRSLARICFELNPRFREVTTGFHFKKLGLMDELSAYLQPGYLATLVANSDVIEKSRQQIRFMTADAPR